MRFDGSNDRLQCARVATSSNFTCIIVLKAAAQDNRVVLCQHAGPADLNRTAFCVSGEISPFETARLFFNNGTSRNIVSTTAIFTNQAALFCSESNGSGASHVRIANGAKEGVLTGQSWTPLNTNTTLGALGNATTPVNGDVSSVAFFTEQCSDALRCRAHHAAAYSFKISCN